MRTTNRPTIAVDREAISELLHLGQVMAAICLRYGKFARSQAISDDTRDFMADLGQRWNDFRSKMPAKAFRKPRKTAGA